MMCLPWIPWFLKKKRLATRTCLATHITGMGLGNVQECCRFRYFVLPSSEIFRHLRKSSGVFGYGRVVCENPGTPTDNNLTTLGQKKLAGIQRLLLMVSYVIISAFSFLANAERLDNLCQYTSLVEVTNIFKRGRHFGTQKLEKLQ